MLATVFERNQQCRYGQNLRKIANKCKLEVDELTPMDVKNNFKYCELPEQEYWRIPIMQQMFPARDNHESVDGLSHRDIKAIINYVCTV